MLQSGRLCVGSEIISVFLHLLQSSPKQERQYAQQRGTPAENPGSPAVDAFHPPRSLTPHTQGQTYQERVFRPIPYARNVCNIFCKRAALSPPDLGFVRRQCRKRGHSCTTVGDSPDVCGNFTGVCIHTTTKHAGYVLYVFS